MGSNGLKVALAWMPFWLGSLINRDALRALSRGVKFADVIFKIADEIYKFADENPNMPTKYTNLPIKTQK